MKNRKFIWGIIFIISLIITVICACILFSYSFSNGGNMDRYIEPSSENTDLAVAENHNINWKKLSKDNPDIYSWIYIPNTNVDYPIVQADKFTDDSFYLHHNIKKQYEFAGAIYTEKNNAKDYSDPVTLIYGHNMKNGSMFKTLHYFSDPNFFKENRYIYIYMPNHKLTYKIYAAYIYDDRHILQSFDFTDRKVLRNYLKYTQNPDSLSKQTRKITLDENSKIITLSTCTSGAENTRYLVQGVLTKDEQTQ